MLSVHIFWTSHFDLILQLDEAKTTIVKLQGELKGFTAMCPVYASFIHF